MQISLSWLNRHIALDEKRVDEVAEVLTSVGLEVEGLSEYKSLKGSLDGVVVGQVTKTWQHPNADKLKLTTVDIGADEQLQIVCGAPNVSEGQKVAVATVGTKLTFANGDEIKIKKGKIRGEASYGMLCAEDELGLGEGHDGIMVLDPSSKVGAPLESILDIYKDQIIEIGLTPNRVDAASHRGTARDLSAKWQIPLRDLVKSDIDVLTDGQDYSIDIRDQEGCPRYTGLKISGVTVKESPDWIKNALKAIGLQPINNVVDVTNYVMHDLGHPLHAFDLERLDGRKIVVRKSEKGEKLTTLDGVVRALDGSELLICDGSKPIALAGVLGGMDSGISDSTTEVLLECAYFNPSVIRRCAKKHQLKTDASFRFERGVDPNDTLEVISAAARLIAEFSGGEVDAVAIDAYPNKQAPVKIDFSLDYLKSLTGFDIDEKDVLSILEGLGIAVDRLQGGKWILSIPTFKPDVTRPIDVVEEVMRVYGYDNAPLMSKMTSSIPHNTKKSSKDLDRKVSEVLRGEGLQEIRTSPFDVKKGDGQVTVKNPLSAEMTHLRKSHVESGLKSMAYNLNRQQKSVKFFERANEYGVENGAYLEEKVITCWMCGDLYGQDDWVVKNGKVAFHHIKSVLDKVLNAVGVPNWEMSSVEENEIWSYGLKIEVNGKVLATVGEVASALCERNGVNQSVFASQINYATLLGIYAAKSIEVSALSKFPRVMRDLSFVVNEGIKYADLLEAVKKSRAKNLIYTHCFDLYKGKPLEKGFTSYALRFVFEDKTKTLSDKQIDKAMQSIAGQLESIGCQIRK